MTIDNDLVLKAIEKFGQSAQIDMVIEECSELITALQHYKRSKPDISRSIDQVNEEIADVFIVLHMAYRMFDELAINHHIRSKQVRLWSRILESHS